MLSEKKVISAIALNSDKRRLQRLLTHSRNVLVISSCCHSTIVSVRRGGYYAALLPRRGRILRRTLSVCLSVCPSVCLSVRPSRYGYRASRRAT